GAKRDREAEVFQVSNDDTVVAQRRLKDKQPEDKTNMNCLFFCAEDTTRSTYLLNTSPSSAIGFKKPRDMLGFFGWLASIEQVMLEPVKVKCIILRCHKSIVGNKLWRLDDVTSKVVLYRNMGFNKSREYKKTFIGSSVFACEVISKWKAGLKEDMDVRSNVYVLSNGCKKCSDDNDGYYWEYTPGMFILLFFYIDDTVFFCGCKAGIWATKGLLDKAKENVLGMEIIRDQSGNTLWVSQSRFYNGKLVQTLLEGYSILSLEGSISRDCDVKKNGKWSCIYAVGSQEYKMVCTRLNIASLDVGYGLMILGYARSLKATLQNMEALSTTEAKYMTFTEAWKKKIWLKGLLRESRY
nr:zinc finger, CCHC-type [Tanacetum cinerariifolium]